MNPASSAHCPPSGADKDERAGNRRDPIDFARQQQPFQIGFQRYPVDVGHAERFGEPLERLIGLKLDIA